MNNKRINRKKSIRDTNDRQITNNIKILRETSNLTLKELAKKARLSFGYINNLELGKKDNPTLDVMKSISTALEKSIVEVFPEYNESSKGGDIHK